jgi:hypothetical protein
MQRRYKHPPGLEYLPPESRTVLPNEDRIPEIHEKFGTSTRSRPPGPGLVNEVITPAIKAFTVDRIGRQSGIVLKEAAPLTSETAMLLRIGLLNNVAGALVMRQAAFLAAASGPCLDMKAIAAGNGLYGSFQVATISGGQQQLRLFFRHRPNQQVVPRLGQGRARCHTLYA